MKMINWMRNTILLALVLSCDISDAREWSDTTGEYRCAGSLEEVQGEQVVILKSANARRVRIAFSRLSELDRAYVQQCRAVCKNLRSWTILGTTRALQASFVRHAEGQIVLRKLVGEEIVVAWELLADSDRRWVVDHLAGRSTIAITSDVSETGPPVVMVSMQNPFQEEPDKEHEGIPGGEGEAEPPKQEDRQGRADDKATQKEQIELLMSLLQKNQRLELLVGYRPEKRKEAHGVILKYSPQDRDGNFIPYNSNSTEQDGAWMREDLAQISVMDVVVRGPENRVSEILVALYDESIFEFVELRRVETLPPIIVIPPTAPPGMDRDPPPAADAPPAPAEDPDEAAPPRRPDDSSIRRSQGPRLGKTGTQGLVASVTAASGDDAVAKAALGIPPAGVMSRRFFDAADLRPADGRIPNDPLYFPWQWGLAVIRAPRAWCVRQTSDIVVAIIDTGADLNHEDLKDNLHLHNAWLPSDEQSAYQHVFGYDFVNNDDDPTDDHGHGTHVAGIAGACGNNCVGVTGVNWSARLMIIKAGRAMFTQTYNKQVELFERKWDATFDALHTIKGIVFAVDNRAWIINLSLGSKVAIADAPKSQRRAIEFAERKGVMVVCAAGNSGNDNDGDVREFPASLENPNVLSVASLGLDGQLSPSSSFGKTTVDLAAPGTQILSTISRVNKVGANTTLEIRGQVIPPRYTFLDGTSMAAPMVSGAAALVWGHPAHKNLTAVQIKEILLRNVRRLPSLSGKCVSEGVLDIGFLGDMVTPESCCCHCCVERRRCGGYHR